MVYHRKASLTSVLTWIVQDSPPDADGNPGIEGRRPGDPYAGSPSEEYSDEYDDGWSVSKGQEKGTNPQVREHGEDAVEVNSSITYELPRLLTWESRIRSGQETGRARNRIETGTWILVRKTTSMPLSAEIVNGERKMTNLQKQCYSCH